ncbi:MAG: hypothetical protein ACYTGP_11765 [Planctomycetota bacterium]
MSRRLRRRAIPKAGVIPYRYRNGVVEVARGTRRGARPTRKPGSPA